MSFNFSFIPILFLFLINSTTTYAFNHIDDLLKNSDVTWAAETYTDYAPNVNSTKMGKRKILEQYGLSRNIPVLLKEQKVSNKTTLASLISKNAKKNRLKLFKDTDFKKRLRRNEYTNLLHEKEIDLSTIKLFRVKQVLYFNKKSNHLELTPIAIAPVHCTYNEESILESTVPLFWVSVKDIMQNTDLSDPSIAWAKQITRTINFKDLKVIKGEDLLGKIILQMFTNDIKSPKGAKIYDSNDRRLTISELKKHATYFDTFDLAEFSTRVRPKSIQDIRVIQDWVWNKKNQTLSIKLVAFAPIVKRYDNNNNYINSGPFFYKHLN